MHTFMNKMLPAIRDVPTIPTFIAELAARPRKDCPARTNVLAMDALLKRKFKAICLQLCCKHDVGKPLVLCTYAVEGDAPLVFLALDMIEEVCLEAGREGGFAIEYLWLHVQLCRSTLRRVGGIQVQNHLRDPALPNVKALL